MASYKFNLKNKGSLDQLRSPYIYEFNLARNLALLSDDPAVIRYFYQVEAPKLCKDQWIVMQIQDRFLGVYRAGQAFAYFGICPMIVRGKVGLVASGGFKCKSDAKDIDEALNILKDEAALQDLFSEGVYYESGLGDFLYRLSYAPDVSRRPLIDIAEPQNFEVNYDRGKVVSYVIKEAAEDDSNYQLHEIHYLNQDGFLCIMYRFYVKDTYVAPNDAALVEECRKHFPGIDTTEKILPFRDFATIVYKQNAGSNKLYRGQRGVPDIQGLDTIEDALTETLSDLIDAIRKGGVKEYIDDDLRPQDADGNNLPLDPFNKTIIFTKGSSTPGSTHNKHRVVQGEIRWQAYTETIQKLMSVAINKAGLSPTTLGLTGLESINSSAESQEAREKTSIRTRELALKSWEKTLTELLNKYLQILNYINGREILDYKALIKIDFDEYISPSQENITDVLAKQVGAGLKSRPHAIMDLNSEYDIEDAENEALDILAERGAPVLQNGTPGAPAQDIENAAQENGNLGDSDPLAQTANKGIAP